LHRFDLAHAFDALRQGFTQERLRTGLGANATVGAIRLSMGVPTVEKDIDRALGVIESFADARAFRAHTGGRD
jgi:hypothetical protein